MATHLKVLAVLHILAAGGELLLALLMFGIGAGFGLAGGDVVGVAITTGVVTAVGFFFLVLALPGLILAYGLLSSRSWSRPLGYVLGVLYLINFPFGTMLGLYTLWVLTQTESKMILAGNKVL
ncbi:MAG: hypothetical protein ACRELV_11625 [Longimicrobiales bacterium]